MEFREQLNPPILKYIIMENRSPTDEGQPTCMTVSHLACFPISEAMWAEVEDSVDVVWKGPETQINQVAELIHRLDVCICSTVTMLDTIKKCHHCLLLYINITAICQSFSVENIVQVGDFPCRK